MSEMDVPGPENAPSAAGEESSPPGGSDQAETEPKRRPRAPRTRTISAWVLVVLVSILIPVSVISVWAIRTVTNTDQYVATMAPLATNQVIVEHLATRATDELFSTHIVQDKVTAALPAAAKPIVTPVVSQVKNYVYGVALKVFESPKFSQLWNTLNRHSHEAVVDVLTGKQSPLTKKLAKAGAIVVDVSPAMNNIIDKLDSRGVTIFDPLKTVLSNNKGLSVTVVTRAQVSKFSGYFNLIVKLKWIIPIVALVLAILAVLIAVQRRKTLLRMAVGVSLVTLLILAGLSLGRITFLNKAAGHQFDQQVAAAVWDTLLRFLKTDLRWTLLIAVLVALGAWLAGPARYAVWIRSTVARGGRWVGAQARGLSAGAGRAAAGSERVRRSGGWILEHVKGLRILGVIVAALFVVFAGNMTGGGLLVIVIVLAVYLGLLQLVAAWARKVATSGAAGTEAQAGAA
jgi:hypothetical protein